MTGTFNKVFTSWVGGWQWSIPNWTTPCCWQPVTPTSKNARRRSPLDFNRFHITLELKLIHLQQNLPSYFNWLYANIIFENCCGSRWDEPSNTCPCAAAVGISSVLLYDLFLCWAKTLEDVSKNTKKISSYHTISSNLQRISVKKTLDSSNLIHQETSSRYFKIITWHSTRLIDTTPSNDNKSRVGVQQWIQQGLGNFKVTNPANPNSSYAYPLYHLEVRRRTTPGKYKSHQNSRFLRVYVCKWYTWHIYIYPHAKNVHIYV